MQPLRRALQWALSRRHDFVVLMAAVVLLFSYQNCDQSKFQTIDLAQESSVQLSSPTATTPTTTGSTSTTTTLPAGVRLSENPAAQNLAGDAVIGIQSGQIFQRQDGGRAHINLTVKSAPSATTSYFSISLLNSSNGQERVLSSGSVRSSGQYSFDLSTGLASRKVRLSFHDNKGVENARWISPGFSVGEIFLISGQSNSSNHGEAPTTGKEPLNRGVDPVAKTWVAMADPLPYATSWAFPQWGHQANPGGSPWPSFADDLSARLQVPVAVISVGWGGSAVSWWVPGYPENYFNRLVVGAQSVPDCGFRAVLWHQGESDAMGKIPYQSYQTSFKTMVSAFRATTGCQQPWMIAQVSYNNTKYWIQNYHVSEDDAEIMRWNAEVETRRAQRDLAKLPTFLPGPDTDLIVAHKYRFDDLHFSTLGLPIHGKLWSQKVQGFLGMSSLAEQDLVPEVKTVWNDFKSVLHRTDADLQADSEGVRYWTEKLSFGLVTEVQLIENLRNSDEAFVRQAYTEIFLRQPTWEELNGWLAKLNSGAIANRTQLRSAIQASK